MELLILIVLGTLFYTSFQIFAALTGGRIDNWLATVLFNGIGTVVPLSVYLLSTTRSKTTGKGILFASLAGVAIMLFSLVLARLFSKGGNISYVVPTIYGSAIVLSSLFGWFVLKDKVSALQVLGVAAIAFGVSLVVVANLRSA